MDVNLATTVCSVQNPVRACARIQNVSRKMGHVKAAVMVIMEPTVG